MAEGGVLNFGVRNESVAMDKVKNGNGVRNVAGVAGTKVCCLCRRDVHVSYFRLDKARHDGLSSKCRPCANAWHKEYRRLNPGLRERYAPSKKDPRASYLKAAHKLTRAQYDELLASQGHGCAICGNSRPGGRGIFHIDHDHVTGKIRGILCASCNLSLGMMKDNTEILKRAIEYLEKSRGSKT